MGGRRATTISDVLGSDKSYPRLERELQSALSDQNPHAISSVAAELAARALPQTELDTYLTLLVPFIKKELSRRRKPQEDIRRSVRREWSQVKKANNVEVRRVVNDAVVQAAIDVLKRAKK